MQKDMAPRTQSPPRAQAVVKADMADMADMAGWREVVRQQSIKADRRAKASE